MDFLVYKNHIKQTQPQKNIGFNISISEPKIKKIHFRFYSVCMTNIGKVKNELIFIAQHSLRPRKNPRESLDYYIESSLSMKPTDRTNQKQPTSIGVTRAAFSSALSLHI